MIRMCIVAILCVAIGFTASFGGGQKKSQEPEKISTEKLLKEFIADAGKALTKYKNKRIRVEGTVQRAEPVLQQLLLKGYTPRGLTRGMDVRCTFSPFKGTDAAKARPGQKVIVEGEVRNTDSVGNVVMWKCKLVK